MERLLKLDLSNTGLLSLKQENLKTAITTIQEKPDELKTAQEQAKAQMESGDLDKDKYEPLQWEIIATEEELKRLACEAAEANTALNKIEQVEKTMESVGVQDVPGQIRPDPKCDGFHSRHRHGSCERSPWISMRNCAGYPPSLEHPGRILTLFVRKPVR